MCFKYYFIFPVNLDGQFATSVTKADSDWAVSCYNLPTLLLAMRCVMFHTTVDKLACPVKARHAAMGVRGDCVWWSITTHWEAVVRGEVKVQLSERSIKKYQ
jgi:hypothetical protein